MEKLARRLSANIAIALVTVAFILQLSPVIAYAYATGVQSLSPDYIQKRLEELRPTPDEVDLSKVKTTSFFRWFTSQGPVDNGLHKLHTIAKAIQKQAILFDKGRRSATDIETFNVLLLQYRQQADLLTEQLKQIDFKEAQQLYKSSQYKIEAMEKKKDKNTALFVKTYRAIDLHSNLFSITESLIAPAQKTPVSDSDPMHLLLKQNSEARYAASRIITVLLGDVQKEIIEQLSDFFQGKTKSPPIPDNVDLKEAQCVPGSKCYSKLSPKDRERLQLTMDIMKQASEAQKKAVITGGMSQRIDKAQVYLDVARNSENEPFIFTFSAMPLEDFARAELVFTASIDSTIIKKTTLPFTQVKKYQDYKSTINFEKPWGKKVHTVVEFVSDGKVLGSSTLDVYLG